MIGATGPATRTASLLLAEVAAIRALAADPAALDGAITAAIAASGRATPIPLGLPSMVLTATASPDDGREVLECAVPEGTLRVHLDRRAAPFRATWTGTEGVSAWVFEAVALGATVTTLPGGATAPVPSALLSAAPWLGGTAAIGSITAAIGLFGAVAGAVASAVAVAAAGAVTSGVTGASSATRYAIQVVGGGNIGLLVPVDGPTVVGGAEAAVDVGAEAHQARVTPTDGGLRFERLGDSHLRCDSAPVDDAVAGPDDAVQLGAVRLRVVAVRG